MDKLAPEKTRTIVIRENKEWFTDELRHWRSRVRRRERIYRKYGEDHQWRALQKVRNSYNFKLKETKKKVNSDLITNCKGDTKRLYQTFNKLTGVKKENPLPEGKSNDELAEEFADFFLSKIEIIRNDLKDIPSYQPYSDRIIPIIDGWQDLSQDEVKKLITTMATKSCEMDIMPTKILKQILVSLLEIITKIINCSLRQGVFVSSWKRAVVRPLLKKSGLDLIYKNYRPVSNLVFLSKVLEKAALQQFSRHCDTHSLLPDYQSAYRAGYSCETALVKLMNDLLWAMEHQEISALMAIDLSAAFDTVDHDVLLDVLKVNFGVQDNALRWFDSYLRPRSCMVNIGDKYSTPRDLAFSVPQGSYAGPLLYLSYASTMAKVVHNDISIYGYADDHALRSCFNANSRECETAAINSLQDNAVDIKSWMDKNRLKMNTTKTEFILFGFRKQLQKCSTISINIVGDEVTRSSRIKYLGAILDEELNLKLHIQQKCKTAMYGIHRIKSIRSSLTQDAAETLALGIVMSHIDYANAIFVGLPQSSMMKLQRVQNMAVRVVLGDNARDMRTVQCLKLLHWLPVRLRVKFKILVIVYKALNNLGPNYIRAMLTLSAAMRTTRSNSLYQKLEVPNTKRKIFADRTFSVQGPRWWNELPNDLKQCTTVDTFKTNLKTLLFDEF